MKRETFTVTDTVTAVTDRAVLLKQLSIPVGRGQQEWIAKRLIIECDTDLDDIEAGEEITIEIPQWLAREKGLE